MARDYQPIRRHSSRLSQAAEGGECLAAEASGVRLASDDYPEMGDVLRDRPDPGSVITVVGALQGPLTAATYGRPDDPRDEEYNGGPQDAGMYWAEPGQQEWKEEHLGPQEAVPPPPWAPAVTEAEMPPSLARLAQVEEARQLFGAPAPGTAPLRRRAASDDAWQSAPVLPWEPPPGRRKELEDHLWLTHGEAWGEKSNHPPLELHDRMHHLPSYEPDHQHDYPGGHDPVFGARHRATTINGTQIDDHGDAPGHGTVPRASAPDSYDARSTEGDGDPKWSDPVDKRDAEDFNGATVGMYPEGISSGSGPGLPIGAFTAHQHRQPMTTYELEQHMLREHAASAADLSALRMRAWHAYPEELEDAHSRVSQGRPLDDWYGETVTGHGRPMSHADIQDHLYRQHGVMMAGGHSPGELEAAHEGEHANLDFAPGESHGPAERPETEAPDEYGPDQGDAASWMARQGPLDPVFGSRVPWTGKERGSLHRWQDVPTGTWGDFVPSDEFLGSGARQSPAAQEEREEERARELSAEAAGQHLAAFGPDPAEEANMRDHLLNHHGWTAENADRAEARGDRFTHMHDTLHQMGMANHVHQDPAEAARQRELSDRFGDPYQAPVRGYSHPRRGGTPLDDPADAISHSVPVNWQATFDKMPLRSWSALDPPHPHDDESSSLDSGPSEGDEGFPGLHDDLQSPDDWPLAQAGAPSGPAYTQGARDGHGGRVFPPPPPPPMPAAGGEEPPGEDGGAADGKGRKIQIEVKAHLEAFTAAVTDPRFRFEFTAAWSDVVAKARRIRREGHVRITHASAGMVIGEVRGDHDTYESGLQRPPGKPQTIQHWACGCPWASFHQDKSLGTRYAGRPCSHVMALQYEAQARGMFGKSVARDEQAPAWSKRDVTVKSWPPYEGEPHAGRWAETWLAPSASLRSLGAGTPGSGWYDWDNRSRSMVERSLEDHLRSQRSGKGWETELIPNHHFVAAPSLPEGGVTHLLRAYHNGTPAGVIGLGASNNMKAWKVHHVHVMPGFRGQGAAGAMMDSFYDHARSLGAEWVDHGRNTGGGNPQLRGYAEPHPDMNIHNAHPDAGWNRYFHAPRVYHDMQANHAISPGTAPAPDWRSYNTWDDAHRVQVHNRWTKARGLPVSPARGDWPGRPVNDFQEPQRAERPRQRGEQWREPVREPDPEPGSDRYNFGVTMGVRRTATPDEARDADWTPEERDAWDSQAGSHDHLSAGVPAQQATAALVAAGEDLGELIALARLGGFSALVRTADQANAPWGSENVSKHPPVKPYGATEPLNRDQSPASYGFLAAPDPDNWGGIQDDSAMQMPLSNTASLPPHLAYPDISDWQPEDQDSFGYADRANTAGPSTSITPRDPGGIRMEESRRDCPCCDGSGEHDTGRECYGCDASGSADGYSGPSPCDGTKPYGVDSEGHQVELDPQDGWQHLDGSVSHEDGTTVTDRPVRTASGTPFDYHGEIPQLDGALAELHDEPEPALPSTTGDDIAATAAADGTIGGGDAGDGGEDQSPSAVAGLGEFGASTELSGSVRDRPVASGSVREEFRRKFGGTPMGDLARETSPQAQQPSPVGQEPGTGSMDELLSPDNPSVQTIGQRRTTGQQQWSGAGADSDEVAVPPGEAQGSIDDIVASFQRSAAARQLGGGTGGMAGDGDIAGAARQYLSKTADALPDAEAAELIAEGRGQRARNLSLLRLEGTHYEDEDDDLARRGVSLDDYDDDVISV